VIRKALVFLLLFVCLSCRERALPPEAATAIDDAKPQAGGTIVRRLDADIATLNPLQIVTKYDHYVLRYLYDPLLEYDANLDVAPGLAEKWEVSPDGREYTFHLDPKARFSDGTAVTAADVLFTLKKIIDPTSEAVQYAGMFDRLDLKKTRVVDDRTIVVAFTEALAPQVTWFFNVRVLPEHVYGTGNFKTAFDTKIVGTGPYKLARRTPGQEILLERRDDYWGTKPFLEKILFKVITDDATAWNALKRGDIDEMQVPSEIWVRESVRPELKKYIDFRRFYTLNYNFVPWNLRDPLLADKRVRRALAMCIDLESVVKNLYRGTARAMSGPFTPDQWSYNPEVPVIKYDPQEAKRILNSLGWLDTDGDGWLDKNKKPFRFEMVIVAGNIASGPFAQLFQAELKNIGVDMKLSQLDGNTFMERVLGRNFQAAVLNWDLDPDPDPYALFHSSQMPPRGYNFIGYSNPQADKLIEAGHREIDRGKRTAIYRELHALLADEQPYTWTTQVSVKWALNKRVRNAKESKGWGLFLWHPGELDWWIPAEQRTHDRPVPTK
jgi:peptide/nickel transport system substrate-binding protein